MYKDFDDDEKILYQEFLANGVNEYFAEYFLTENYFAGTDLKAFLQNGYTYMDVLSFIQFNKLVCCYVPCRIEENAEQFYKDVGRAVYSFIMENDGNDNRRFLAAFFDYEKFGKHVHQTFNRVESDNNIFYYIIP